MGTRHSTVPPQQAGPTQAKNLRGGQGGAGGEREGEKGKGEGETNKWIKEGRRSKWNMRSKSRRRPEDNDENAT